MSGQLTPEQVNEFLAKAVLDSQIGEAVKEAINRVLTSLKQSYNNPIDDTIRRHMMQIVDQELQTTYKEEIRVRMQKALQEYLTAEVIEKIIDAGLEKIRNRY